MAEATKECERCLAAYKSVIKTSPEPNTLILHVDVDLLTKNKRNNDKKKLLRNFERHVSAIGNSRGGVLLVHLQGQLEGDLFLGYFDQAVDQSLKNVLPGGGCLFTDAYAREWLHKKDGFQSFFDFVVVTISNSRSVFTVEYNTKVTSDHQVERPTASNLLHILSNSSQSKVSAPVIKGIPHDLQSLHEHRSIQLKAFYGQKSEDKPGELANYIWKQLRFQEYMSCMSKLEDGGSYYVGIEEETNASSKRPVIKGFKLKCHQDRLKECLLDKLNTVLILGSDKSVSEGHGLIAVDFHDVGPSEIVLEIAVRSVAGIVFYERGPEAYETVEGGKKGFTKMSFDKWLDNFTSAGMS